MQDAWKSRQAFLEAPDISRELLYNDILTDEVFAPASQAAGRLSC